MFRALHWNLAMCDYSLNPSRIGIAAAQICVGAKNYNAYILHRSCCSVVVILLLTRKPHGKPTTRSHEHNTHPFPLQTGNGACAMSLTHLLTSPPPSMIQAADAQTILLLLEGLGRPVLVIDA
jgi:hypothetical protein